MDKEKLLSFHNEKAVKDRVLAQVMAHAKADEIRKGYYWQDGKGCAVGCTIHGSDHGAYERELGIPHWLARLEDRIFEGLPNSEAKKFPAEFLESISVGVDLEPVKYKFLAFVLTNTIAIVEKLKIREELREKILKASRGVLEALQVAIDTGVWVRPAAAAAAAAYADAAAADAAAAAAAAYAAAAAAAAAADAAAAAAAYADADAAAAYAYADAAAAAARSKARSNAYIKYRDELLRLLRDEETGEIDDEPRTQAPPPRRPNKKS